MSKRRHNAESAPRCVECGGTAAHWIDTGDGIRWTVRDIALQADGKYRCVFCRAHPDEDFRAARYTQLEAA